MRTTIDLPEDLHRQARSIAHDSQRSFSAVVAELIRRGLRSESSAPVAQDQSTGLPVLDLGKTITSEDVRSLEDEE